MLKRVPWTSWTTVAPPLALVALVLTLGMRPGPVLAVVEAA